MASSRKARAAESSVAPLAAIAERVLRPHVVAGETLTIGLSGGIDSMVLLDLVRQLQPVLGIIVSALHVNHGLSPNAGAWESFCRAHCAALGVGFEAVQVEIGGEGVNVEEEARIARYRAFERHAGRVVLLAHNRNDQAETVLFRMLRGAGVHGLSGMPRERMLSGGSAARDGNAQILLRPLLAVSRKEIEDYARSRDLRWIDDESNTDSRYARNFLRTQVLPLLEQHFPGCQANLARTANHLAEADALLRARAQEDLQHATVDAGIVLAKLGALGRPRAAQALRLALEAHGEPAPSTEVTREVLRQLFDAGPDRNPSIELDRTVVRRYRGCAIVAAREDATPQWSCIPWDGRAMQRLPDASTLAATPTRGLGVSQARLAAGAVTLRRRVGGESLRLRPGGPQRTLRKLLQEHGIPPWQRRAMPLLYCGEQLVWVPAVGVASEFVAAAGESGWEFTWVAPPSSG